MKLGLSIGYSGAHLEVPVALVQRAEELGYDSVWSAEAYGSDAITPLAFLAARTNRIKLGTGIMQLAARTPANAAMAAASIDAMSGGGRFIAGLGVSGPQIVEGWYGQPWGRPYYRVKDYVAIMRKIFKREEPVTHEGREISLPYKGEGSAGLAKPLKSILHMNPDIPIYLATGGETMVKLTAEIADGWLPMGFVPGAMEDTAPGWRKVLSAPATARASRISPSRLPSMSRSTMTSKAHWRGSSRKWRSMSAAWGTRPRTSTTTSWCAAASATLPSASRSSTSLSARMKPSPQCPTNGSTTNLWLGRQLESSNATVPGRIQVPIRSACARANPRPSR